MRPHVLVFVLWSGFASAQSPAAPSPQQQPQASGDIFDQLDSTSAPAPAAVLPGTIVIGWTHSDPRCTIRYSDGVPIERFSDSGRIVEVWGLAPRDKNVYTVLVGVQNHTRDTWDVDPAAMSGLTDENPQRMMPSINADALIAKDDKAARRRAAAGNALAGFAAGYGSNTTATVQNSDGSTSTATIHTAGDVSEAERNARENAGAITAYSQWESERVLRRNTLSPGQFVIGRVYIEKPKGMAKKATVASVTVVVEGTAYIFPVLVEPARR